MKRILSVLLLVVMLVCMTVPAFAIANPFTRFVKTGNGGSLRVRSGPGTNFDVLMELPYRTMVTVVETKGDWCQIELDDRPMDGAPLMWVMKSFLVSKDPGPWKGPEGPTYADVDAAVKLIKYLPEPYRAEIITKRPGNFVHLRWIPNTDARFIDKYLAGEEIEVLAESKYWAQVRIVNDGYVGFILRANVNPLPEEDGVGAAQ